MATEFLHGAEVIEVDDGIRPIRTVKSSVIGLVGTAPDADTVTFPLNEPVLIAGNQHMLPKLGVDGTLQDALKAMFYMTGVTAIVVRVDEGAGVPETMSNIIGSQGSYTGLHALQRAQGKYGFTPRLLLAPGYTAQRPANGVVSIAVTAGGTGYTTVPNVTITGDGSGATAHAVLTAGVVTSIVVDSQGAGYTTAPTVTIAGGGGTGATATATRGAAKNPVTAAMVGIANKLRGMVFADGPATSFADALAWRNDFDTDRVHMTVPDVLQWDTVTNGYVQRSASAALAGIQVYIDHNRGFWHSPSNTPMNQIGGTSRPIDFTFGDYDCEANLLNEKNINTVVNWEGWRSWGNHTLSSDEQKRFTPVRRTADMIFDSIIRAALTWMDRPLSQKQLILNIVESSRAYMRELASLGAIVGGNCWLDPDMNTESQLMAGHLNISFDYEPPAPLERLTYRAHRNPAYYRVLVQDVLRDLNRLSPAA
ncbi:phage tail sheath C-terminal domain-containing protein [Aestuariivirga sp. YIM B02566]|uniref:Phage tail sheath subtilisin-like domain-containing protein n=1 Tax=Taklimakanibacter albus TaxID=2800327 RepID=A0ACC5R6F6_9HYPH|nr:phage tail sheath C-terminal domain-containing protein [Aestuariivirga sp. YIM B02566]MBK1868249.1 phage tail sheath subtilisin-like domain-containing protein [Aestuariivirga sp. YIM B02566]